MEFERDGGGVVVADGRGGQIAVRQRPKGTGTWPGHAEERKSPHAR